MRAARRKASAQDLPDWRTDPKVMELTERVASLTAEQRQLEEAMYTAAGQEDARKNYADQCEALHMAGHASAEEVAEAQQAATQIHQDVQRLKGQLLATERELATAQRALPMASDDAKIRTAEALQAAYHEAAVELSSLLPQMVAVQERLYEVHSQAKTLFPPVSAYRQLDTSAQPVAPIAGLPYLVVGAEWIPRISPSGISPKPKDHFGGPIAKLQTRLAAFLAQEGVSIDA